MTTATSQKFLRAHGRPWAWSAESLPPHDVRIYEAETTAGVARLLGGNDEDYGDELVQQLAESDAELICRAVNTFMATLHLVAMAAGGCHTHCAKKSYGHVDGCAVKSALDKWNEANRDPQL